MSITIAELAFPNVEQPALDETTPGVTVWRDRGEAVAFGVTRGDWHWLKVMGAGAYRFPVALRDMTIECGVVPERGAASEVVIDSYYRSVVPLALQAYGFEVLHGSAVALPGGAVALCAGRETGKSTIAFALQHRGHGVVADDAVVVSVPTPGEPRQVTVQPLPFALRLRGPSAGHFSVPGKGAVLVGPHSEALQVEAVPLAAIVMLARHDGPVEGVELGAREAFPLVLSQSYAFSLEEVGRKRAMVGSYLRLVNLVPTYRLAFPSGLEHLDSICEAIEGLAGAARRA